MEREKTVVRTTRLVYQTSAASPPGGVTLAGFIRHSVGVTTPMRVFGRFAAVLLLEGSGRYRDSRGVDVSVAVGDLIWVLPELGHWYGPGPGELWSEFYVVFEGPVFDAWRSPALLDPRAHYAARKSLPHAAVPGRRVRAPAAVR